MYTGFSGHCAKSDCPLSDARNPIPSAGYECQTASDILIHYASHYALIIEVYGCAVVSDLPIFQEQVREVRVPFFIRSFRMQVMPRYVFKYLMELSGLCSQLFRADDRMQIHLGVHIFIDEHLAVVVPSIFQIGNHTAVSVHLIVTMVDLLNLFMIFQIHFYSLYIFQYKFY